MKSKTVAQSEQIYKLRANTTKCFTAHEMEVARANAAELLAALKGMVEFMGSIGITSDKPDTDAARRLGAARAAIRKAEGRK